jgi:hypothetical protein
MLKLVTDNTTSKKKEKTVSNVKTCRKNCVLFNDESNSCSIFKGLNYDDPNVVKRCLEFTDVQETEAIYHGSDFENTAVTIIDEKFSVEADLDFLFELTGNQKNMKESNYPFEPDIPFHETMNGLFWYTSPDQSFGCWIKNDCRTPLGVIPSSKEEAKQGWAKNIYRSPIPLHDHQASDSLKSRMCWYVDEEGWGQYTVILANKIKFLTYPKPKKW